MSKTTIEWTQHTWNPTRGCSRISPGCVNCYAERQAARFCAVPAEWEGTFAPRPPFHGFVERTKSGPRWTGRVELIPEMLEIPLRRKKPTTYFVDSMSDLFHEALPLVHKEKVFRVMLSAPHHTYQILTKRASVMLEQVPIIMNRICGPHWRMPDFIWLGVSVEDRQRKDRIELLRQTPAAVRFLSLEPLLEDLGTLDLCGIDWVIVGGESGPGARPCDLSWVRSIVRQCKYAGVDCFVKQLGARPRGPEQSVPDWVENLNRKGGNWECWPEDLRVREMPIR